MTAAFVLPLPAPSSRRTAAGLPAMPPRKDPEAMAGWVFAAYGAPDPGVLAAGRAAAAIEPGPVRHRSTQPLSGARPWPRHLFPRASSSSAEE